MLKPIQQCWIRLNKCGFKWQIDALKTFVMPQQLIDEFGYPQITDEIREGQSRS